MKVEAIIHILPLNKIVKMQFIIVLVVIIFLFFSFSLFVSLQKEKAEEEDDDLGYLENIVFEKGGCEE